MGHYLQPIALGKPLFIKVTGLVVRFPARNYYILCFVVFLQICRIIINLVWLFQTFRILFFFIRLVFEIIILGLLFRYFQISLFRLGFLSYSCFLVLFCFLISIILNFLSFYFFLCANFFSLVLLWPLQQPMVLYPLIKALTHALFLHQFFQRKSIGYVYFDDSADFIMIVKLVVEGHQNFLQAPVLCFILNEYWHHYANQIACYYQNQI